MRSGNDMKAVAVHRKRAVICKEILELHGHHEIVAKVRRQFQGFAKANHRGYIHNADGLTLALDELAKADAELHRIVRKACALR